MTLRERWRSWGEPRPITSTDVWALRIVMLFVALTAILKLFGVLPLSGR